MFVVAVVVFVFYRCFHWLFVVVDVIIFFELAVVVVRVGCCCFGCCGWL